jgi:hypothetical protein
LEFKKRNGPAVSAKFEAWRGGEIGAKAERLLSASVTREASEMAWDENETCLGCGNPIAARRDDARFCSAACRQAHYRRRLAAKVEARQRDLEAAKRASAHAKAREDFIASLIG